MRLLCTGYWPTYYLPLLTALLYAYLLAPALRFPGLPHCRRGSSPPRLPTRGATLQSRSSTPTRRTPHAAPGTPPVHAPYTPLHAPRSQACDRLVETVLRSAKCTDNVSVVLVMLDWVPDGE